MLTPVDESRSTSTLTGSFSRVSPGQAAADAIPLLIDDTYHLFHLTTPPFTRHHPPRLRSAWWRLRSTDLVHWTRDRRPCVTPSDRPDAPDADGAWTGAAVLGPDGVMNIFYTGYNLSQGGRQVILRAQGAAALSDNGGAQDTEAEAAATAARRHASVGFVCPGTEITFDGSGRDQLEDVDFRDPFVFYHAAEGRYWMVVASRLARGPSFWTRGCIALLTSPDLERWTFALRPLYAPNDIFCPECPELFYLEGDGNGDEENTPAGKWYLVYSRFHGPDAGTVYRVGDSPYGPFHIPRDGSHGRLDGRRWYAAKSCPQAGDPQRRRVFFGWIGDYVEDEGKWLWGGDMGMPRIVSAVPGSGGCCLQVAPAAAVVALDEKTATRVPVTAVPPQMTVSSETPGVTAVVPLDLCAANKVGGGMESLLTVQFRIARCDAHAFGIVLQPDGEQRGHRLQFTPHATTAGTSYTVTLLTDVAPLDDFWADQYKMHLPRPVDGPELVRHDHVMLGPEGVRMFLRGQLVEVFCGGRSLSFRLPRPAASAESTEPEQRRLSWFVQDGEVTLAGVSVRYGGQLDQTTVA